MTCYLMLMLLGIMLTGMYEQKQIRIYAEITAFALNLVVPVLFYYLDQGALTLRLLISVLPGSILTVAGMHFYMIHYIFGWNILEKSVWIPL